MTIDTAELRRLAEGCWYTELAHEDLLELLDELDRLRAEVERRNAICRDCMGCAIVEDRMEDTLHEIRTHRKQA